MRTQRALTLVEVIVVVSIVALVCGLTLPVLAAAKMRSLAEVSKSYLRQQYLAMAVYAGNSDDVFPSFEVVMDDPSLHAPCSPLDHWAQPCWRRKSPMLGSFGYSKAIPLQEFSLEFLGKGAYPLLADIFTADYRVSEFSGIGVENIQACFWDRKCEFPERIWYLYSDGTLRAWHGPPPVAVIPGEGVWFRTLFDWKTAFERGSRLLY